MVTAALLWATRFYVFGHLFKNLIASSHLFVLKRLSILKHESNESGVFITIPIALGFCIVNSLFSLFEPLNFFNFEPLAIFQTYLTMLTRLNLKGRFLPISLFALSMLVLLGSHVCVNYIFSFINKECYNILQPPNCGSNSVETDNVSLLVLHLCSVQNPFRYTKD